MQPELKVATPSCFSSCVKYVQQNTESEEKVNILGSSHGILLHVQGIVLMQGMGACSNRAPDNTFSSVPQATRTAFSSGS